jgi:hypothetical protein
MVSCTGMMSTIQPYRVYDITLWYLEQALKRFHDALDKGQGNENKMNSQFLRQKMGQPVLFGKFLLIYICIFHVLNDLLLIYICKLHWNRTLQVMLFNSST